MAAVYVPRSPTTSVLYGVVRGYLSARQWTGADMQRHLRYERGRLSFETDLVRTSKLRSSPTGR